MHATARSCHSTRLQPARSPRKPCSSRQPTCVRRSNRKPNSARPNRTSPAPCTTLRPGPHQDPARHADGTGAGSHRLPTVQPRGCSRGVRAGKRHGRWRLERGWQPGARGLLTWRRRAHAALLVPSCPVESPPASPPRPSDASLSLVLFIHVLQAGADRAAQPRHGERLRQHDGVYGGPRVCVSSRMRLRCPRHTSPCAAPPAPAPAPRHDTTPVLPPRLRGTPFHAQEPCHTRPRRCPLCFRLGDHSSFPLAQAPPQQDAAMTERLAVLKDDPELKAVFEDMAANGAAAMSK
jgi:hypothetical protein